MHAHWTLMIYMNAEPEGFEESFGNNLKEMYITGSSADINIMLLVDRCPAVKGLQKKNNMDKTPAHYHYPSVYRVAKNTAINIDTQPLHVIQNDILGTPEVLQEFMEYTITHFPANRYMLLFWDHGTGTAVQASPDIIIEELKTILSAHAEHLPFTGMHEIKKVFNNYLKHTDTTFTSQKTRLLNVPVQGIQHNKHMTLIGTEEQDYLYVEEIRAAIQAAFKGRQIDIIAFDACWMQMIENAYTLRNTGKYMVASENLISAKGFGYGHFLQYMSANPDSPAEQVCRYIINGTTFKLNDDDKLTLSCVDLSTTKKLCDEIDQLSKLFTRHSDAVFPLIATARFLCLTYYDEIDPVGFNLQTIDLVYFLKLLLSQTGYSPTDAHRLYAPGNGTDTEQVAQQILQVINTARNEFILLHASGVTVREENETQQCWGAQGFSIFFPEHVFQWELYKQYEGWYADDHAMRLSFAKDNNWATFLEAYFNWLSGK